MLVGRSVDAPRVIPVEAIQGREFSQGGSTGARDEVARLALAALHLDELLGDLHRALATAGCLLQKSAQRFDRQTEAEESELGDDLVNRHRRSLPGRGARHRGQARCLPWAPRWARDARRRDGASRTGRPARQGRACHGRWFPPPPSQRCRPRINRGVVLSGPP